MWFLFTAATRDSGDKETFARTFLDEMLDVYVQSYGKSHINRGSAVNDISKLKEQDYDYLEMAEILKNSISTTLTGLVEKALLMCLRIRLQDIRRCPLDEFCENRVRRLQELKEELLRELPSTSQSVDGYITIKGATEIINKLKNTIVKAKARIYVSATDSAIEALRGELTEAVGRGLKVVIITGRPFVLEGAIIYYAHKPNSQIRLIADSQEDFDRRSG